MQNLQQKHAFICVRIILNSYFTNFVFIVGTYIMEEIIGILIFNTLFIIHFLYNNCFNKYS